MGFAVFEGLFKGQARRGCIGGTPAGERLSLTSRSAQPRKWFALVNGVLNEWLLQEHQSAFQTA